MEWLPELLDLVLGAMQISAGLFLVYGACLAIREAGVPQISAEPALASAAASPKKARPREHRGTAPRKEAGGQARADGRESLTTG